MILAKPASIMELGCTLDPMVSCTSRLAILPRTLSRSTVFLGKFYGLTQSRKTRTGPIQIQPFHRITHSIARPQEKIARSTSSDYATHLHSTFSRAREGCSLMMSAAHIGRKSMMDFEEEITAGQLLKALLVHQGTISTTPIQEFPVLLIHSWRTAIIPLPYLAAAPSPGARFIIRRRVALAIHRTVFQLHTWENISSWIYALD